MWKGADITRIPGKAETAESSGGPEFYRRVGPRKRIREAGLLPRSGLACVKTILVSSFWSCVRALIRIYHTGFCLGFESGRVSSDEGSP